MIKVENGRKRGDLQVQFKWVGFYGCCTADLVLASEMSLVEAKIISQLFWLDILIKNVLTHKIIS